ncbi:MAG: PilZ domain-containing protein [Candidatus Omnitrophica bacterium]|nr:PilZ domain-containing protein [Candidatus Omnitrophota bacterium]MDD5352282.1 PilZ domain-containing protein [Candidatus Omnitrophota bacterium]MDD5549880.1 PilZ domain-containing protein [Candidatus Omnitrophota bacterium]
MNEEKRLHKRISLSLPINYEVLETEKKEYNTTVCKDISEGGIRLVLKKFYPPKTKLLLKISLEGINKVIEAMAETVWSYNMRFANTYHNGLRFINLDTRDQNILREYIAVRELTEQ